MVDDDDYGGMTMMDDGKNKKNNITCTAFPRKERLLDWLCCF